MDVFSAMLARMHEALVAHRRSDGQVGCCPKTRQIDGSTSTCHEMSEVNARMLPHSGFMYGGKRSNSEAARLALRAPNPQHLLEPASE